MPDLTDDNASTGGPSDDCNTHLAEIASQLCGDLRFVAAVADVAAVLRRPYALGNCILRSCSISAGAAAYVAARFLRTRHAVLSWRGSSGAFQAQLLGLICSVLTTASPVVVTVPLETTKVPDVLVLMQALLMRHTICGQNTPAVLLELCGGDTAALQDLCRLLAPDVDLSQVRAPSELEWLRAAPIVITCC